MSFPRDIYYTLSESLDDPFEGNVPYDAPGKIDRKLEKIEFHWLQVENVGNPYVSGFKSKYASGNSEYSGLHNTASEHSSVHTKDIIIHTHNPIVAIQSEYQTMKAVNNLSFGFKDGKWTGYVPYELKNDYTKHIVVRPPEGYYLTSIWAPSQEHYYYSIQDVVFGFSLDPKLLNNPLEEDKKPVIATTES